MTDETEEELIALVAAARAIQAAAEKAVADLAQLVANNRAVPAQIAREGAKARQSIQDTGDRILANVAEGAEKAIRDAAVNDVGTKIETAMVGPLETIDESLSKLKQSASIAEFAADRWQAFTRMFRWQQLAVALLCGILIGAVGHWYFASRGPETEAAEYILSLKNEPRQKTASAPVNSGISSKNQKPAPSTKSKPKDQPEPVPDTPEPMPDSPSGPETAEPPQ